MAREQSLPDRSIRRSGKTTIDRTQHLAQALAPLRGHAGVGRYTPSPDGRPEACKSGQAVGRELIENDESRKGSPIDRRHKIHIEALAAHVQSNMGQFSVEDGMAWQIISGKVESGGWRSACLEVDCSWIELRGPEDRLGKSRDERVGAEIVTPIVARTPRPFSARVGRWTQDPDRLSGNQDFGAGIPKRGHRGLDCRYSHRRSQTANFHLRTSSTTSALL